MINSVKSRWLSVPLLVLSLHYALAQAPSGPLNFAFNSGTTAVYDLSSPTWEFDQNIIGPGGTPVPLSLTGVALTHDPSGRLHGVGEGQVLVGNDFPVAARYTANGRVSGGGDRPTRVLLNINLTGNDVLAGVQTSFGISVHYDLEVDQQTLTLIGTARGHASFRGVSSGRIDSDNLSIPLPANVDGSWSAQLNIVALSNLGGSGNVVLSNGRTLPVRLSGSFSGNTGLAHIHTWGVVNGLNDGRPTPLRMTFATDAVQPNSLSGTIMGQRVIQ